MSRRRPPATLLALALALAAPACEDDGGLGPVGPACSLGPGDLLITEVMAWPEAAQPLEWFEIHNPTDRTLSLAGLVFEAGTPTRPRTHRVPAALDPGMAPGAYLVVGNGALGDGLTGYSWDQMALANDGALITLRCGTAVVDQVTYGVDDAGQPVAGPGTPRKGISWQFSSRAIPAGGPADPAVNESPEQWCPSGEDEAYDRSGNRGTPGAPNRACVLPGECLGDDGYRAALFPGAGDLVLTEWFANPHDPPEDGTREWFEVRALKDVDLNGLVVTHDTGSSRRTLTLQSPTCLRLAAGAYGLVAETADPAANGGLPAPFLALKFPDLLNGAVTVTLAAADGLVVSTASVPAAAAAASQSLSPAFADDPAGAATAANWCTAATSGAFTGRGTPGAPNEACP